MNITNRDIAKAQAAQKIVIDTLTSRGLPVVFENEWPITQYAGITILFAVIDVNKSGKLEQYESTDLVHHLSTVLRNKGAASTVILSNSTGLRYAIIISDLPKIPKIVKLPGFEPGKVLLGQGIRGQVSTTWQDMVHVLVGGMTGSGKSTFIRALVHQARQDGMKLLVCDPLSVTFSAIENDPALLMPVQRLEGVKDLLDYINKEMSRRENLYRSTPGFPENLDEYNSSVSDDNKLPRILVVLEEINATINRLGGPSGEVGNMISSILWTARKFGIHVICSSQDFSSKFLGTIRDQTGTVICFRVKNKYVAKNIGVPDASKIPASRQGLAVSDRFGVFQAYYILKSEFSSSEIPEPTPGGVLSEEDISIMGLAVQEEKLSIPLLKEKMGMADRRARNLLADWEAVGWVQKDPSKDNARVLTSYARELLLLETSQNGLNVSEETEESEE